MREWKEQLQVEVIENYIFLAEMRPKAKDKTAHMVEMRASWEKLCSFIESLLEEQRKEIQESGSALLDYQAQVIKQDLINQILQEMDEYDSRGSLKIVTKTDMRELLTKHLI